MKFLPLSLLFVAAGVAVAAEVLPNKPYDGPIKCEGSETSLTISGSPSIQAGTTLLLTAQMTFTLPTESPAYDDEVRASKLAITADTDGTLLVADGNTSDWVRSGYTVADGGSVMMRAEGKLNDESKLAFKVTFSPIAAANSAVDPAAVKTVSVVSPASATTLSGFTFTGEGETSALTLGLVDTAILPPTAEGSTQDSAQVEKYIAWANEAGSAVANDTSLTDGEKQNAFAMNAGGTPSLTITAIDPTAGTITVKGSYTTDPEGTSETPVDLKTINGVLTIASRESLGGTETIRTVNVTAAADGKAVVIPLPEDARFVKAAVSVNPPAATADEVNAE
ncbi:MAG: hypothetical protein ACI4QJ_03240 [Candidatus Spyradenecus sp.]